tara:strand:+ start:106 stop:423 length:318 start_codon:yes stop_codon:yes gene_type:complete
MTDFSNLMQKAKEIESKMKESQENIKKIEADGTSGANDVKVTLNGEGNMVSIKISENILNEEKTILEDLITAAHNNAKSNLKSKTAEEISKVSGNFGIPGFKWPL